MNTIEEIDQLKALFRKLGASSEQSAVMAKQLVKRTDQWVEERGLTRVEAMQQLLELVVAGRAGETPPGFEGISKDNPHSGDDF